MTTQSILDNSNEDADSIRESFAIQGSIVMNTLELLIAETDRILRELGQNVLSENVSTDRRSKHDSYKGSIEYAPPRKRIKLE